MSTSLLYHAFGIRGYRHVATHFSGGRSDLPHRQGPRGLPLFGLWLPLRGSRGQVERPFRCLPIGQPSGDAGPAHPPGPVPGLRGYPPDRPGLRRPAAELHQGLCPLRPGVVPAHDHPGRGPAPGRQLGRVKEIVKQDLQRRFARPKLKHLRQLAIDEICVGSGHRYLTLVLDLESGAVVHVGRGKGGDALKAFWKRLRRSGPRSRRWPRICRRPTSRRFARGCRMHSCKDHAFPNSLSLIELPSSCMSFKESLDATELRSHRFVAFALS